MAIILDGILSEKALRAAAGDDLYERGEGHVEAVCVHSLAVGGATATVGGEAPCDVHLFWHDDVVAGVCTCPRFSDRGFCEHMVAVGLAVLDDVRDGAVVPAPPSGAFAAPPAPADSGPAPRGGRARTATPDPGDVKDIGAELLRSARSLTVVRRFLRPGEAARYARSIERFLDGLESFPADRGDLTARPRPSCTSRPACARSSRPASTIRVEASPAPASAPSTCTPGPVARAGPTASGSAAGSRSSGSPHPAGPTSP